MALLGPLHIAHGASGVEFWVEKEWTPATKAGAPYYVRRYAPHADRLRPTTCHGPYPSPTEATAQADFLAGIEKARALIAPKE